MTPKPKRIEVYNSALYLPDIDVCVVSDLHIGLEDELLRQGISFPLNEEEIITTRLSEVIERFNPHKTVLNGDILHSFGKIWSGVSTKLEKVLDICGDCVLIEGSHDKMLPTLMEDKDRNIHKHLEIDGVFFLHGDRELPLDNPEMVVLGHEHPAIEIEGDKLDCFLVDRSKKDSDLILTPSFSPLTKGVSVNRLKSRDFMSPIMNRRDLDKFEVLVEIDSEVLRFPELGSFRDML
ncbi:Phosphohydrolase Icc/MPP superfamily [Methanonatronarchaeum thermophilum]|uniref:Phosphohydrolase Icc/MPP superfamily n=1 Tax=Methanonatronarchaeum thermophilum TaxID=1927129 RepID=A0A1Y3GFD9_9EURY|nr:hypothetical protein [Methanonatronarchaeum thermophilum]OUJ18175.1 Phosphohydrolase Icc/MPP superfamily [Methanonatronarchaeum thermophilum]